MNIGLAFDTPCGGACARVPCLDPHVDRAYAPPSRARAGARGTSRRTAAADTRWVRGGLREPGPARFGVDDILAAVTLVAIAFVGVVMAASEALLLVVG
jgi:hypothetical protein